MKKIILLVLVLSMLMCIAACKGGKDDAATDQSAGNAQTASPDTGTAPAASGPNYGGTLTIQLADFNTVFDPAMGEQYVYSLWLEYLFGMDWGLNDPSAYPFAENTFILDYATGQIAKSWVWDPANMTFTVTIRDDIYFQEKTGDYDIFGARNMTADDIKYSYDRVTGQGSGFTQDNFMMIDVDWRPRLNMLESTEVTDKYTVVFHMNTASETRLSEFIIAQINITGPEWDTLSDSQKSDWRYACGTGPFILTDYAPDNHFTFVRNGNYYAYDERYPDNRLPYLDGIVLQKFSDSTSIISNFISGSLDYIPTSAGLSDSERLQIRNNVNGVAVQSFAFSAPAITLKVNNAPFNDINVRIAMQKAINLEEVNSAYYGNSEFSFAGLWASALTNLSAVNQWDAQLRSEYTYDPDAARQLLADAGYADGFEFTIALDPMADVDVFQLAKGYLAEVGITMNIEILPDMMAGREVQGNPDDPRVFNFDLGASNDPGFAFQSFATVGFAYSIYHGDTALDGMLAAARDAMTLSEQETAAKAVDLYFMRQHWLIAISGLTSREAFVSPRLGGLENGEQFGASHFFKTIAARVWVQ